MSSEIISEADNKYQFVNIIDSRLSVNQMLNLNKPISH